MKLPDTAVGMSKCVFEVRGGFARSWYEKIEAKHDIWENSNSSVVSYRACETKEAFGDQ